MSDHDPLGPSPGTFWAIIGGLVACLVLISLVVLGLYLSG
jgi:hypothetical protein